MPEKTLESPLDCNEIQLVHPKGDQSWVFTGRTDAEAETLVLWPPHANSWLIGKDSDAGRDRGQEEKGMTEDEMAGWHHWLDGHWVRVNPRSWWWTGRPGMLRFMGLQRVRHDWATELNWTELSSITISIFTWTLFPFFFAAPVLLNLFSIPYRIGLWHGWEIWLIHLRGHDLWLSC